MIKPIVLVLGAIDVTPRECRTAALDRLIRPASVAVVGVSDTPGSVGMGVVTNLEHFQYDGDIYLVSRKDEVGGRKCYRTIDELPPGIDVVILCIPASAAVESVQACARRGVGAVMLFGAGYAEAGPEGKRIQHEIETIASQAGMLVEGPNCMGLTNFVDGIPLTFAPGLKRTSLGEEPAVSILTQSGGMMSNLREISQARGLGLSHAISTGNEATIGVEDFLEFLIDDVHTHVIALYVEQIRRPQEFLKLAKDARTKGKVIVLLHPGKSQASREAAMSHTGSLVGDVQVIRTVLEAEGVLTVDSIEDLVDAAWLLNWFGRAPHGGAAMLTDSGAVKGFALDYCESCGLQFSGLSSQTLTHLDEILPAYTGASNPLDVTAQALREPRLYTDSARALLEDEAVGSLMVTVLPGSPNVGRRKAEALFPVLETSGKPALFIVLGEGAPLADELVRELINRRIPLFRSVERAMRAMACVNRYRALQDRVQPRGDACSASELEFVGTGAIPEFVAKAYLKKVGIKTPKGVLCNSLNEAQEAAERLGFPVVIKAQTSELAHKSDVGGVIVGIEGEEQLSDAWLSLQRNIHQSKPSLVLDGVLVEQMAHRGIEVVVGGKRDAQWGPVLMVGLGGVWVEVMKDVRLIALGLSERFIVDEVLSLQASAILRGARGNAPSDVHAIAETISAIGRLMESNEDIEEIEINPLIVYPEGQGAIAVDALMVFKDRLRVADAAKESTLKQA